MRGQNGERYGDSDGGVHGRRSPVRRGAGCELTLVTNPLNNGEFALGRAARARFESDDLAPSRPMRAQEGGPSHFKVLRRLAQLVRH